MLVIYIIKTLISLLSPNRNKKLLTREINYELFKRERKDKSTCDT